MNDEIERDMPECEKWNQEETPSHDVHEMTTFELAEAELKAMERQYARN